MARINTNSYARLIFHKIDNLFDFFKISSNGVTLFAHILNDWKINSELNLENTMRI